MNCYNYYMTNHSNNHFIYLWVEQQGESKIPFYVGQGTHMKGTKYFRALDRHVSRGFGKNRTTARPSFCQLKADKLKREGNPHLVEILFDNLTKEEANKLETDLILHIGRRDLGLGTLCNLTNGGESYTFDSPITRENHLKAVQTEENRKRVSDWITERLKDPEIRDKQLKQLNSVVPRRKVTHKGIEYASVAELSKQLDVLPATIIARLNKGRSATDSRNDNKIPITYNGIDYESKSDLAKSYNMSIGMLEVRLKNNIPLENAHRTKTVIWDGVEYKCAREISEKLGWSLNAVKRRIVNGEFIYSDLTSRNVRKC